MLQSVQHKTASRNRRHNGSIIQKVAKGWNFVKKDHPVEIMNKIVQALVTEQAEKKERRGGDKLLWTRPIN